MTLEEVKQIINNSELEPSLKQRLLVIAPTLGKYTLSGLGKEISRKDSLSISDYLTTLWENFANLLEGLKKGGIDADNQLVKFIKDNLSKFTGEDGLYILNLVLDVRQSAGAQKIRLSPQAYEQILEYEALLFWQLPEEEILFLLGNHLIYLLQKINLLQDTQAAVYKHDWDFDENFNKPFLDVLYKNEELFGTGDPKSIGVWLKQFLNFATPTHSQSTAFGVAEFLSKDPSVQKLTKAEKENLSEILKLHGWLLEPITNEKEILDYIDQKTDEDARRLEQELNSGEGQAFNIKPKPPIVPAPKNAPTVKPISEIRPANPPKPPTKTIIRPPIEMQASDLSKGTSNIQDILRKREQEFSAGLKLGSIDQTASRISMPNNPAPNKLPNQQAEIDKKLQELNERAGKDK